MPTIRDASGLRDMSLEVRGVFLNGMVHWRQVINRTTLVHDGVSKMKDTSANCLVLRDLVREVVGREDCGTGAC